MDRNPEYYKNRRTRRKHLRKRRIANNKKRSLAKLKKRKAILAGWKAMLKKYSKCCECGEKENLTFDHVRGEKKTTIANNDLLGFTAFWEELEKCDIVCRWCHDAREHLRGTATFQKLGNIRSQQHLEWMKAKRNAAADE